MANAKSERLAAGSKKLAIERLDDAYFRSRHLTGEPERARVSATADRRAQATQAERIGRSDGLPSNPNPAHNVISLTEAADLLNLTPGRVRQLCRAGRVVGARLVGPYATRMAWVVPLGSGGLPELVGHPGKPGRKPGKWAE